MLSFGDGLQMQVTISVLPEIGIHVAEVERWRMCHLTRTGSVGLTSSRREKGLAIIGEAGLGMMTAVGSSSLSSSAAGGCSFSSESPSSPGDSTSSSTTLGWLRPDASDTPLPSLRIPVLVNPSPSVLVPPAADLADALDSADVVRSGGLITDPLPPPLAADALLAPLRPRAMRADAAVVMTPAIDFRGETARSPASEPRPVAAAAGGRAGANCDACDLPIAWRGDIKPEVVDGGLLGPEAALLGGRRTALGVGGGMADAIGGLRVPRREVAVPSAGLVGDVARATLGRRGVGVGSDPLGREAAWDEDDDWREALGRDVAVSDGAVEGGRVTGREGVGD